MNTSVLNVKTDPETKEQFQAFAAELGLTVSALINSQIKQMLRTGKVELSTNLEPTPYLQSIAKAAESDYANNKNVIVTETDADTLALLRSL